MSDLSPTTHPDYFALNEEIAALRNDLAFLLTREHEMTAIEQPNLLALYQQKIGAWELRRLEATVKANRAKRRLEMAQVAINRGQAPDWTKTEVELEAELLRWQQLVSEATNRLKMANHRLSHLLGPDEDRELKRLYHSIVKALHPDLHPEFGEPERRQGGA